MLFLLDLLLSNDQIIKKQERLRVHELFKNRGSSI